MNHAQDRKNRREELLKQARGIAEKAKAEGRDLTASEQSDIDAQLVEIKSINSWFTGLERSRDIFAQLDSQAAANSGGIALGERLAFGAKTASALATKVFGEGGGQKTLAPSGTAVVGQEFNPDPIALGRPATNLLSILPTKQHLTPEFAYLRQTARTNNAAVVAEAALKPTSVYTLERVSGRLDVVAHLSEPCPRFWLVDNDGLQAFIAAELLTGLQYAVEKLAMDTIAGTSGVQTNAFATNAITTLRGSITKLETQGYAPSAFVVNPVDWQSIELSATATAGATDHQGLPYDPATRRLYGVPVCVSTAQAAGAATTLAEGAAVVDTDTNGVGIQWSESTGTDFEHNLIRARCEGRYATSVYSPLGVVLSTLK
jgi:hypothetical protein